jgi:hypothetical protein
MVLMHMALLAYRDSPITATEAGTALRVVVILVVTEVGTEEVVISNPVPEAF